MEIPPGALSGNQEIKIQLLGEELPVETPPEDEVSLCASVRCLPSGLRFKEPVKLTFNHCSELTEQVLAGEGELILYSRDEDAEGNEKMMLTREQLEPPRCRFFKNSIEVYVDHFSSKYVRMTSRQSKGKTLGCLAFLPIEMPTTRKPILRVYVYNYTEGHKERIKTEELAGFNYRNVAPETLVLIRSTREGLTVICLDQRGRKMKSVLAYDRMQALEQNILYFELDYSEEPVNQMNVKLQLHQGSRARRKSRSSRALIMMTTTLEQTRVYRELPRLSELPKEPESASVIPVEKDPNRRLPDAFLHDLAEDIENTEQLESLMRALHLSKAVQNRTIEANRMDGRVSTRGTNDMLFNWRQGTEISRQRAKMETALGDAKLYDLRDRMFSQDYEDDP